MYLFRHILTFFEYYDIVKLIKIIEDMTVKIKCKRKGACNKSYKVEGNLIAISYAESLGWNLEKFKNYIIKKIKKQQVYVVSDKGYTIITFSKKEMKNFIDVGFKENKNTRIIDTVCLGSSFDCYQYKKKIKLINKDGDIEIITGKDLEDIRYLEVPYNNYNKEPYVAGI